MINQTRNGGIVFQLILVMVLIMFAIAAWPRGVRATVEVQEPSRIFAVNAFPNLSFNLPVDITHAGDSRLFVVEQDGVIKVLNGRGLGATSKVFLDISSRVTSSGEMGLLGLAFHPDYQQNGYFYVNYTRFDDGKRQTVISRFSVTADPNTADPASEFFVLVQSQPYSNHNGGSLKFAPDGTLYIGLGDGGSGGDPDNRAQNGADLLGKMLRIDVDNTAPGKNYAIPVDNPFVGKPPLDEIWAIGLRNPWRFSFDRLTGDLYIGDVGQNQWEEINFQPAASAGGQNYGWRLKEGNHCYNPQQGCDPGGLTDPIYEYNHSKGCSVTGGYVYRGPSMPTLQGFYLYADYCSGVISALHRVGQSAWHNDPLTKIDNFVSTFGEDSSGEIYVAERDQGRIVMLVEGSESIFLPYLQKQR